MNLDQVNLTTLPPNAGYFDVFSMLFYVRLGILRVKSASKDYYSVDIWLNRVRGLTGVKNRRKKTSK